MLTEDELKAAEPSKTHTIDIEQFVALEDIDPVMWDQTYYVAPEGQAAAKAYGLLREAMDERHRVAIGRFVMRTKEYLVCIRPFKKLLALQTMFFPDEVRDAGDLVGVPGKSTPGKGEMALARQLIESLSGPWKPAVHQDTFRERVMALARKKDKGEAVTAPTTAKGSGKVLDLMAALKATLAAGGKGKGKADGASREEKPVARRSRGEPRSGVGTARRRSHVPARAHARRG
jgi:DNA end-binding protein Ku